MSKHVTCQQHGLSEGCMICQHLVATESLGFARLPASDDGCETAMCESCEALLLSEQEWSEAHAKFAGWKLFCGQCFEKVLLSHTLVAEGRTK
jgi:hypothetical protein